jgi:hypothetical protein
MDLEEVLLTGLEGRGLADVERLAASLGGGVDVDGFAAGSPPIGAAGSAVDGSSVVPSDEPASNHTR